MASRLLLRYKKEVLSQCMCPLCKLAQIEQSGANLKDISEIEKSNEEEIQIENFCPECFAVLKLGIKYPCTKQATIQNLKSICLRKVLKLLNK